MMHRNSDDNIPPHSPLDLTLADASRLLGCVSDARAAQALLDTLFRLKWCWRPEEMAAPRVDPVTGKTTDVCVWGAKTPTAPSRCRTRPIRATTRQTTTVRHCRRHCADDPSAAGLWGCL